MAGSYDELKRPLNHTGTLDSPLLACARFADRHQPSEPGPVCQKGARTNLLQCGLKLQQKTYFL